MENEELKKQVDAFTEAFLLEFDVRITPKNWFEKLLIKAGWKPAFIKYQIKPAYVVTMAQVCGAILSIKKASNHPDLRDRVYQSVTDNSRTAAKIIAYAIRNQTGEPDESLITQIQNGLEAKQLFEIYLKIIESLDIRSFTNSIASLTELNILQEPSRESAGGIIASMESQVPSENITA